MTQNIDPCATARNNMLAAALALQHCAKTAANIVPIPDRGQIIAIGTPAEVARLLVADVERWAASHAAAVAESVDLVEPGALRQFCHNDGSSGFVVAYDKEITDRVFARLSARTAEHKREPDWFGYHSALSQCAEMLDNMSDGDKLTETPRFLAEKLESIPKPKRECNACDWVGETDLMLGSIGPLCPQCGETTEPAATPSTAAVRAAALEEAAKLCEQIESERFDAYKGRGQHEPNNPWRADPYVNGESDGAGQCANKIRALINTPAADGGNRGEDA